MAAALLTLCAVSLNYPPAYAIAPPHLARDRGSALRQPVLDASDAALSIGPQTFEQLTPQQAFAANATIPISTLPNPPAQPFKLADVSALDRARAENCLTMAIYYEAASQGPDGEAAVAQVVLNRMRNPLFPKSVCGVVFQGAALPTGCQFTFTCDGSLARKPSEAAWKQANDIAERALNGYVQKTVGEATHYHTVWVVPYWQSTVIKVAQVGAHIFYRWKGALGLPGAFESTYAGAEPLPSLPKYSTVSFVALTENALAQMPSSTPVATVAVEQPPVVVTPVASPIEVAAATLEAPPSAPPSIAPPRTSYFGHGGSGSQRLATPSRW